ncbi:MAG: HU family DNA-binding protein [Planctomycetota bacterium]
MATITKKELVNRIADRTGQTKVITKEIIQFFLDEIITELSRGNRLEFREFGVFEVKPRKARRAQNPRTLEKVQVPPKKVVKFKVGRIMREKVGDGLADEYQTRRVRSKTATSMLREAPAGPARLREQDVSGA